MYATGRKQQRIGTIGRRWLSEPEPDKGCCVLEEEEEEEEEGGGGGGGRKRRKEYHIHSKTISSYSRLLRTCLYWDVPCQ
jgi:hypothetical protein